MELYEKLNKELVLSFKNNASINHIRVVSDYKLSEGLIDEIVEVYSKHKPVNRLLNVIVSYQSLSEEFIEKHISNLNFRLISFFQKLSEDFIERHKYEVNWFLISLNQNLSEEFIKKHFDKINLNYVCENKVFSDDFIEKYYKKIDSNVLCKKQKLSEKFIENHLDDLDIYLISKYQKLSESFIDKHKKVLYWREICIFQKLSEDFIERHLDYIWWDEIFKYQKLSDRFIKKYQNKVNFSIVSDYQKCSDEFKISDEELFEKNWLYMPTENKKQAVIDTGKYDCYDDYFIAYKAIRKNRYSLFNFQYKYEKGGVYESNCDCTQDENSFGLNVGTEEFAIQYGYGVSYSRYQLVRCKVRYEDIGRIVHDGNKVRCFKIEVLD